MKAIEIEVVDVRNLAGEGKCRAAVDVRFGDELVVRGFFVWQGKNGLFVSLPRKQGADKRWYDLIEVGDDLKRAVEDKILEAYDRES